MGTAAAPEAPPPPRRLSEELELILREFDVEEVTLREVMTVLHGRGFILLMLLLSLPFCTPIPLPGLSTPLGCVILLIAVRLALGQKPWLPARFLGARYHSLVVSPSTPGRDLEPTAFSAEGEIMALRHRHLPQEGVQFHPESYLTPCGPRLLAAWAIPHTWGTTRPGTVTVFDAVPGASAR